MRSSRLRGNAAKIDDIVRSQKRIVRLQLLLLRWSRLRTESSSYVSGAGISVRHFAIISVASPQQLGSREEELNRVAPKTVWREEFLAWPDDDPTYSAWLSETLAGFRM